MLVTYAEDGIGVIVGLGKNTATAEPSSEEADCSGDATVTASSVAGEYTCTGIVSYHSGTGKMGKINITIRFTATS